VKHAPARHPTTWQNVPRAVNRAAGPGADHPGDVISRHLGKFSHPAIATWANFLTRPLPPGQIFSKRLFVCFHFPCLSNKKQTARPEPGSHEKNLLVRASRNVLPGTCFPERASRNVGRASRNRARVPRPIEAIYGYRTGSPGPKISIFF